jgi:hypothetical protein
MANRIPFADKKKPRAVMLSDDTWETLYEDSILKGKSPNVICEALIQEYLVRPLADSPDDKFTGLEKKQHNLRLVDSVWKALRLRAHQESRSASSIIEQLLREYYGIPLPPPQLPA